VNVLTELPLDLPGRLFRCAMPFSAYDPEGRALEEFRTREVSVVVVLAETDECERIAGCDLRRLYADAGLEVVDFPIKDFGVATEGKLRGVVDRVLARLRVGRNVAIHCHAGKGRAGTIAACVVREVLGLPGDDAIAWVRRHVPGAVETSAQFDVIRRFALGDESP
jgi:protein-tyrosine phosphatase